MHHRVQLPDSGGTLRVVGGGVGPKGSREAQQWFERLESIESRQRNGVGCRARGEAQAASRGDDPDRLATAGTRHAAEESPGFGGGDLEGWCHGRGGELHLGEALEPSFGHRNLLLRHLGVEGPDDDVLADLEVERFETADTGEGVAHRRVEVDVGGAGVEHGAVEAAG